MFLLFSFSFEKSIVKSSNRKTNDMISWIFYYKWMTKVRNYWWCRTLNFKSWLTILCLSTDRVLFCFWFFLTAIDFKWYETFSTKTSTLFSKRSNFVTKLYFLMDIGHYFLYTFVYWNWLLFIILKLDHHKNKDTA